MEYPEEYYEFIRQFNQGNYYECHDLLEEIWLGDRHNHFLKGMLQLAVALHHLSYGNVAGARLLLDSSQAYLTPYEPIYWGIQVHDVLQYIKQVARCLPVEDRVDASQIRRLQIPTLTLQLTGDTQNGEEELA